MSTYSVINVRTDARVESHSDARAALRVACILNAHEQQLNDRAWSYQVVPPVEPLTFDQLALPDWTRAVLMQTTTCPETINGWPIIRQSETPGGRGLRAGRVILIHRPEAIFSSDPFVTAWQGRSEIAGVGWEWQWASGHYFETEAEALADFAIREKRGY